MRRGRVANMYLCMKITKSEVYHGQSLANGNGWIMYLIEVNVSTHSLFPCLIIFDHTVYYKDLPNLCDSSSTSESNWSMRCRWSLHSSPNSHWHHISTSGRTCMRVERTSWGEGRDPWTWQRKTSFPDNFNINRDVHFLLECHLLVTCLLVHIISISNVSLDVWIFPSQVTQHVMIF